MRAKEKGSECTWLVGEGGPGRPPKAPSSFPPSHRPAASPLGTGELTQGTAEHRHEEHTAEPHRKPRRVSEGGAPWWDYFQSCRHKRGGCKENQQNQISKLSSIHGLEGARAHRRKEQLPGVRLALRLLHSEPGTGPAGPAAPHTTAMISRHLLFR